MKLEDFNKVIINHLHLLKYGLSYTKDRQIFLDMLIDEAEVFWTAFWLRSFFLYCIKNNLQ